MKQSLIIFFFLLLTQCPLWAQGQLDINGLRVGGSYKEVIWKLGKPMSKKKGGEFDCDSGEITTLSYPGLTIELIPGFDDKGLFVASIEVTSFRWLISSRIRKGASVRQVRNLFDKSKLSKEDGMEILSYYIKDGHTYFYFKKGKLDSFSWRLHTC